MKIHSTSPLNIVLHILTMMGFAWFAFRSYQVYDGPPFENYIAGVFTGISACLSLFVFIDLIACLIAKNQERHK